MTPSEIARTALALTEPLERAVFLDNACGENKDLRRQVEALILAADQSDQETITSILPPQETIGTVIGHYKLLRELGEGGMGVVYEARQLEPIRRDVALKIVKPGMDSRQVIARFESERQALAMMGHPNIAQVFEAGLTSTGRPYFVMELVEGVPITQYCDSKHLTVKERIDLFIPVCQAIQHAHQKGIIHRDIKPSNVLVKQEEDRAIPKVIDFGLAKALGQHLSDATMVTNVGAVVGTLDYMSPEQADIGRQDIDTRSDVYSLGALLYVLLTGALPLDNKAKTKGSYIETLQRIKEEEPQRPSSRLRHSATLVDAAALRQSDAKRLPRLLEQELDWIVMKALEKDRARRFETVNSLVRDLQRFLAGEPVEAAPPSAAYRMGKFARKYRLWLATAAAFAAVLIGGVVVSTWMAVRASRAEALARQAADEARAVNEFLQNDILGQASVNSQANLGLKPDPNLSVRTALDRAASRIQGKFERQPALEASIRQTIGQSYKDLGAYPDAQRHFERAVDLRRRAWGEEHPYTLTSMASLASVIERRGQFREAEAAYSKVLALQRRVLKPGDPALIYTLNGLGATYFGQGKYAEAEAVLQESLELSRRVLGPNHVTTLRAMGNVAGAYHVQEKHAQAVLLYQESLDANIRVLGTEHPETLSVMTNLGELYATQGEYAKAEPLLEKALELRRRLLGEEHRDTLFTTNVVADLYRAQGKRSQAEVLYARAWEAGRRVLGDEHDITLGSISGLANIYISEHKYEQAEELLLKAVGASRRALGDQNYDTIERLQSLGSVQLQQRKNAEAEVVFRQTLLMREKTAPDGWRKYNCQSTLGESLAGQKKYAEAEPLLVSGYEGMFQRQATIPPGDRSALEEAGQRIVRLYEEWGKPEKASEWRQKLQLANRSTPQKKQ